MDQNTGKLYLIPEILYPDLASSLTIAQKWDQQKINDPLLRADEDFDIESIKYIIYGISGTDKKLFLRENNSQGSADYYEVVELYREQDLERGTDKTFYAPLLPL